MKNLYFNKLFIFTFLIFSVLILIIFFFGARQFGVIQAKFDLWRGRYEIHGYGLLFSEPMEIELLRPYGIRYRHVAGCVINDFIIERVAAYNEVMKKEIKKTLNINIELLYKKSKENSINFH